MTQYLGICTKRGVVVFPPMGGGPRLSVAGLANNQPAKTAMDWAPGGLTTLPGVYVPIAHAGRYDMNVNGHSAPRLVVCIDAETVPRQLYGNVPTKQDPAAIIVVTPPASMPPGGATASQGASGVGATLRGLFSFGSQIASAVVAAPSGRLELYAGCYQSRCYQTKGLPIFVQGTEQQAAVDYQVFEYRMAMFLEGGASFQPPEQMAADFLQQWMAVVSPWR